MTYSFEAVGRDTQLLYCRNGRSFFLIYEYLGQLAIVRFLVDVLSLVGLCSFLLMVSMTKYLLLFNMAECFGADRTLKEWH